MRQVLCLILEALAHKGCTRWLFLMSSTLIRLVNIFSYYIQFGYTHLYHNRSDAKAVGNTKPEGIRTMGKKVAAASEIDYTVE